METTASPDLALADLPLPQRIAATYAPRRNRRAWQAVLLLDTLLARFAISATEPVLAQLKLAWWRDSLGNPGGVAAARDPLLLAIAGFAGQQTHQLVDLVNGWEALLGEGDDIARLAACVAGGRCRAIKAVTASDIPAEGERAALQWTAAELAALLAPSSVGVPDGIAAQPARLPRALRPLAVLGGLGQRALERGGGPLIADRASAMLAMRLGIFGR